MTLQEAKDILEAVDLELDPPMTEDLKQALELMKQSPELQAWYERQRAMDLAVTELLYQRQIPEPETNVFRAQSAAGKMSRRNWLVAAGAMAGVGFAGYWVGSREKYRGPRTALTPSSKAKLSELRDYLTVVVANGFFLDMKNPNPAVAQDWLAEQELPICDLGALGEFKSMGCMKLGWRETPVSLLCFLNEKKHPFHLFRIDQDLCESPDVGAANAIRTPHLGRNTATWNRDGVVCMLVAHKPGSELPANAEIA